MVAFAKDKGTTLCLHITHCHCNFMVGIMAIGDLALQGVRVWATIVLTMRYVWNTAQVALTKAFIQHVFLCIESLNRSWSDVHVTDANAFTWMKMYELRLKISPKFVPMAPLTVFQHWFRNWLGANQATSHYLNQWLLVYRHIHASLGLNELIRLNHCRNFKMEINVHSINFRIVGTLCVISFAVACN